MTTHSVVWRFARVMLAGFLIAAGATPAGAQRNADKGFEISLVSVGPGDQFFSWMGHAGILIKYPTGELREFDYGVVFDDGATTRAAIAGTAVSYLAMSDGRAQLANWTSRGRQVTIQRLNLTVSQRTALIDALILEHAERKGYRYDLLDDNCTTRVRDLLDRITGGALRRAGPAATGLTVREIGYRQIRKSWVISGFDVILNGSADRPASVWDAGLYPAELARLAAATTVLDDDGFARSLVQGESVVGPPLHGSNAAANDRLFLLLPGAGLALLALCLGAFSPVRLKLSRCLLGIWAALIGLVIGLPGALLAASWAFTAYPFVRHNENLLILNPLLIAAFPLGILYAFGVESVGDALRRLMTVCAVGGVIALGLKAVPGFHQDNWRTLLLVWPTMLATTWAFFVVTSRKSELPRVWALGLSTSTRFREVRSAQSAPIHSSR